jgi:hypothetical protein
VKTEILRLEEKYMANVTGVIPEINYEKKPVPQEQMQREVDYVRAQQILTSMLEKDLITLSEFNKITELNRKTFSPLLAEIMP